MLQGRDLLGIAQTGTGKTAAFMLPAIDRLIAAANGRPMPGRARMLVLAPTRELAAQIADAARAYASNSRLYVGAIFGGVPVGKSIREVSRGLDVLLATPGRLLDLGFIHALKAIVKLIPAKRQTLFFSATMPKSIRQLADAYLRNPAQVAVTPVATTAERVGQSVTFVNQAEKQALLAMFLQSTPIDRALVFSRTKHGADKIVRFLEAAGIGANAIHRNKSQAQRERAIDLFRRGDVPILVATDIAARGIDIPGVSHVLNFDLPNVPEQYVHRIGRTARAGADGSAIAFCADDERAFLRDIERLTRQKIEIVPLPEGFGTAVEAMKRLKPAPRNAAEPRRAARPATKADRRSDGQRRENRNDRQQQQQRQPQRADGQRRDHRSDHPQRADGQRQERRTDRQHQRPQRADGQCHEQRSDRQQQRHPHRADGHPAHRPSGNRPKRWSGGGANRNRRPA